jgi:hypothetical protein
MTRKLLPYEYDLIDALGVSKEEYLDFVAQQHIYRGSKARHCARHSRRACFNHSCRCRDSISIGINAVDAAPKYAEEGRR